MNVADTKPYNADFDGDEMNMHMPQNDEAEMELRHLASIKNQIISPASNSSIIGIFQDSLLGSYLFSEENIIFTRKEAMNLIEKTNIPNTSIFNNNKNTFTSHEIVSAIVPEITIKYKDTNINIELIKLIQEEKKYLHNNHLKKLKLCKYINNCNHELIKCILKDYHICKKCGDFFDF